MRNRFETEFWRRAYEALPPAAKQRYRNEMLAAEHMELGLEFLIEGWTSLNKLFSPRQPQTR
jgi:hypothetical protein